MSQGVSGSSFRALQRCLSGRGLAWALQGMNSFVLWPLEVLKVPRGSDASWLAFGPSGHFPIIPGTLVGKSSDPWPLDRRGSLGSFDVPWGGGCPFGCGGMGGPMEGVWPCGRGGMGGPMMGLFEEVEYMFRPRFSRGIDAWTDPKKHALHPHSGR